MFKLENDVEHDHHAINMTIGFTKEVDQLIYRSFPNKYL